VRGHCSLLLVLPHIVAFKCAVGIKYLKFGILGDLQIRLEVHLFGGLTSRCRSKGSIASQ